jgi:hypothetical protein
MTTTGTRGPEDFEYEMYMGNRIYVKPKELMIKHTDAPKQSVDHSGIPDGSQSNVDSNQMTDKSQGAS